MIGAIITGTTALLFGVLFLFLAISFLNNRNINLIAGYSSMTESEKQRFNERSTAKANGKTMLVISVVTIVFSCISFLYAFDFFSKSIFIISVIVYIASVMIYTALSIIKNN